jgi:hypothetical protein
MGRDRRLSADHVRGAQTGWLWIVAGVCVVSSVRYLETLADPLAGSACWPVAGASCSMISWPGCSLRYACRHWRPCYSRCRRGHRRGGVRPVKILLLLDRCAMPRGTVFAGPVRACARVVPGQGHAGDRRQAQGARGGRRPIASGVLLVSASPREAVVEIDGAQETLLLGSAVAATYAAPTQSRDPYT